MFLQSFFVSYDALLSLAKYIFFQPLQADIADCIRINCDVYDRTSRRGSNPPLCPRIVNVLRHVLSRFFYVFSFANLSMFIFYDLYFDGIDYNDC